MAVLDALKPDPKPKQDKGLKEKLDRGRERMKRDSNRVRESFRFWRGDHYVYVDEKGLLRTQPTITHTSGGGKERHRVRSTTNLIGPVVRQEVSYATQRIPSYQVNPSTYDVKKVAAARLSERIALYGYDKWKLRDASVDAVTQAVVGDEAFAWPYWDTTIGPYVTDDKEVIGQGDVRVRIFGRNQCFWEPGLSFDESPYHAVEIAQPMDEVKASEGYYGGELRPDSLTERNEKTKGEDKLVVVTHYLERPCPKYPKGRWLQFANEKQLCDERDYPVEEGLCLHKLCYARDPDNDRDQGLVRHLVPLQRIYNDCVNKSLEAKNIGLNPQLVLPTGSSITPKKNDEPGQVFYVTITGGQKIEWSPPPPSELFIHLKNIGEQAKEDMGRIAAQNEVPSGVEAGRAIQALIEKDQSARGEFISNLADWHSRLMRHCLFLVQQHYTEPRLVQFRAPDGWEPIKDFLGAHLMGQVDVYVLPNSIEPRTRQFIEQKVQNMFTLGLISPEEAKLALNSGWGEQLIDSFDKDQARAHRMVLRIKAGPESFMSIPSRLKPPEKDPTTGQPPIDPMTGMPQETEQVPGWMPANYDNPRVWRQVFGDYMKGAEFEDLSPEFKEPFFIVFDALEQMIQEKEMQAQQNAEVSAGGLGLQNASKPQTNGDKPLPSQPALDQGGAPNNPPSAQTEP